MNERAMNQMGVVGPDGLQGRARQSLMRVLLFLLITADRVCDKSCCLAFPTCKD